MSIRWLGILGVVLFWVVSSAFAQSSTEQDAINASMTAPHIGQLLEGREDWYAKAYLTAHPQGIWHVNFYSLEGEDWGWADVSVAKNKVYASDIYAPATEAQIEMAYDPVRAFLMEHPDIVELLGDISALPVYVDYASWAQGWGAYIDKGSESLYVVVRFANHGITTFELPELVLLRFDGIVSYDEWETTVSQEAIAIAFADSQVATAMRGVEGWTTQTERVEGDVWVVSFLQGETVLVTVRVDVAQKKTLAP